jgi:16S rRNA (cytosine1402-N4)-methyltransferase
MSVVHVPVLFNEVMDSFSVFAGRTDLIYFDGTFGRGGHAAGVFEKYKPQKMYASDQDLIAIEHAKTHFPYVEISHENFLEFAQNHKAKNTKFDMILLDLGVSSPQLDVADRGFSFNKDGPLDMRMNQKSERTAAKIVNQFSEEDLMRVFKEFGEVPNPYHVVKAIINDRVAKPFETTLQLSGLIERVDGWHKKGFHPATQYFMALRLVVNRELDVVEEALPLLIEQLNDGGRISVITFHSLEDRLVKNLFKDNQTGFPVSKKVIAPSDEECKINPRARSAKLRVFQKGAEPVKPDKFALRRAQRDQA